MYLRHNDQLVTLNHKSKSGLPEQLLVEHVAHLDRLHQAGSLLVCGPFVDDSGAMLVVQEEPEEQATVLILSDPFIKERYYGDFSIIEFCKADASNQYLMDHNQTLGELK